ncbi:MAG: protein translocase subunit SecF [Clostridia bacterium]|nr:protein translocase subunit SecF [Clostridia bacterium]
MMPSYKYDFVSKKKICFIISACIIIVGLLFNVIFGTQLNISFRGGSLITYSYSGDLDVANVEKILNEDPTVTKNVSVSATKTSDSSTNNMTVTIADKSELTLELQDAISKVLSGNEALKDNKITFVQSNSVDPTIGGEFFGKCIVAIVLAAIFMIVYIGLRFRKIGGWSAGVAAVISLIHDVLIVYFTFIICRFEINDNFFAVVLTILGYSINAVIINYSRIRENRRIYGPKAELRDVVNLSLNQSLRKIINTTITTALTIGAVAVAAVIFNLSSLVSFAVPLLIGIISGCYSCLFISCGLWVTWKEHSAKNKAEK